MKNEKTIAIELLLNDHCIQYAAKRMYEKLLVMCFQSGTESDMADDLDAKVEGLKGFLERTDFAFLRSRFPELTGNPPTRVILKVFEPFDSPVIVCNGRDIVPTQKPLWGPPCIKPSL